MKFNDIVGIEPKELPQNFKDEVAKLAFKMGEVLGDIIEEEKNLNLSMCALQWVFPAMCANFFDDNSEMLRKLAQSLANGVIENMEVIIKMREEEKKDDE